MEIVDFAQFARRRSVQAAVIAPENAAELRPQTDRWAALHTEVVEQIEPANDFWGDLQLRVAYPTLHFRHH